MYFIYAKHRDKQKYSPMDYHAGALVTNLIHATIFEDYQKDELEQEILRMGKENPLYSFKLVHQKD